LLCFFFPIFKIFFFFFFLRMPIFHSSSFLFSTLAHFPDHSKPLKKQTNHMTKQQQRKQAHTNSSARRIPNPIFNTFMLYINCIFFFNALLFIYLFLLKS
jgi:hypothetical protein